MYIPRYVSWSQVSCQCKISLPYNAEITAVQRAEHHKTQTRTQHTAPWRKKHGPREMMGGSVKMGVENGFAPSRSESAVN